MKIVRIIVMFMLMSLATACGYKADLYLPDQAASKNQSSDEKQKTKNGTGS